MDKREFQETYTEAMDVLLRYSYAGKKITVIEQVLTSELPHRCRKMVSFVSRYIRGKGYFKNGELTAEGIDSLMIGE